MDDMLVLRQQYSSDEFDRLRNDKQDGHVAERQPVWRRIYYSSKLLNEMETNKPK
jgi:hypothetical protein